MVDDSLRLRGRAVLASWFWLLVVLLVVAVALGGWATYTAHVAPGTQEVTRQETAWEVDGAFSHRAVVTTQNPVFEKGSTLENRSTYFPAVAPILNGEFRLTYRAPDAGSATVTLDPALVIQAAEEGTVYWTNVTSLAPTRQATLEAGETTAVEFSVNATRLQQRQSAIVEAIGGTPGETSAYVAVDVEAVGAVDGDPSRLSFTSRLPITTGDTTYSVGQSSGTDEAVTVTVTRDVPRVYGPLMSIGGPLLFLVAGALLIGLALARRSGLLDVTETELAILEYESARSEFDDWIVRAAVPDSVRERESSRAESLADLVDFAIDADAAAIEDPDTRTVYAVDDDLVVVYYPPAGA
ncbi:MAG: DUF5305 family protein [Halanaeroarchaeum sp.]